MTLLGPSAPGMAFMMKKKKYKFSVELQLEELVEVPFLSAVLFAKIRLLDGGSFQACSNREEVRNHAVKWGQTFEIICKMSANASTGVLDPCTLRISVRKEVKGGRSYQKLGFIDLNLAEYAGSGLIARRCLLEGYDARHRQDNSMLRLAIKMHMLSGDILFKVPSSNVNSKQITSQQDDELCINGNIGSSGGGGGGGGGSNNVQQTPKLLQTSGSRPQDRVTTTTAISSERQIPPGGVMSITTSVTSSSSSSFVTAATTQHQIPISSIMQSSTSASTRDDASIASGSSGFGSLTKNKKSDTLHTNEMMDSVVSSVASATTTAAATTTSTSMYHQLLSSSSSSTCGVTDSGDKSDTFEQNVLPSIQQPQINYPSNMELGHSRNSSNTSQMSKGSGYSSFSHSQHSRQSSEGDSGHQRNPSSGSIVMSETGSLDRMKAAAERRKKGLDDGSGGVGPSVSGRVEGTRVNPDSLIAEILKNTKLDQLEESTESSGLKLYIDKDGNTSLSSHEVQSRMTGGVYKQVVMENPR